MRNEKLQAVIRHTGIKLKNLGFHYHLDDEGVFAHALLQVGQRGLMGENATAEAWLEAASEQKDSIDKTTFYPGFVAIHELDGLAFVGGKSEKYDEHGRLRGVVIRFSA